MKPSYLLLVLPALLGAGSLHAQKPDSTAAISAAQTAALSWLDLVDHGMYDISYDSTASFFKSKVGKAAWNGAVRQVRGPLNPLSGRKMVSATYATTLSNAPPGQYVVIQYATKAKGTNVTETVTPMKDRDGVWRVSGYYIRPR